MSALILPGPGPTAMTFDSLMDTLRRYAERGGLYDDAVELELQPIINRTERDLADRLKILGYLSAYTNKMKIGEPRIAKPQNWRSTVSINYGSGSDGSRTKTLQARSYEYCRAVFRDRGKMGAPEVYADYDFWHWLFLPAPNLDYLYEAMVWRLPPLLSEANQQNYLTDLAPNLMLYTSLQALFGYLKDTGSATYWGSEADKVFGAQTQQDKQRMTDRAAMRSTS